MMRAFAWKPRWGTMRLVNSWERSTLDIYRAQAVKVPSPASPGAPNWAAPELAVGEARKGPMRQPLPEQHWRIWARTGLSSQTP